MSIVRRAERLLPGMPAQLANLEQRSADAKADEASHARARAYYRAAAQNLASGGAAATASMGGSLDGDAAAASGANICPFGVISPPAHLVTLSAKMQCHDC